MTKPSDMCACGHGVDIHGPAVDHSVCGVLDCLCLAFEGGGAAAPLPARPQAIRVSPDGLTVAVLYDSAEYGPRWVAFAFVEPGVVSELRVMFAADVEDWVVWVPRLGQELVLPRQKTVQDVIDGLPPGSEVT